MKQRRKEEIRSKKKDGYIQSYHQSEHLGERLKESVQTPQNLISHYALCQTSQIPGNF